MSKNILNNIDAINQAMSQAMAKDPKVVLWGEDAGFEGGVFRATQGLQESFGEARVFDAPIAEASFTGMGVGAAIYGLKPIVELQFQGFAYPAFQQIMTHAARFRNRSRGRFTVPMVIRMPMGGGVRALEHHSEAIETLFAHIPGLKVVMPSTPVDSKGLLMAAINDPDPVIFLEPKKLYRSFKQEVPEEAYEIEIGKANIIKEGKSITVITYGAQVQDSIQAVTALAETNPEIDVELIDLRTLSPLDTDTIVASVNKTGRVLVINEAVKTLSISSEVIARVNEKCFSNLVAAPARLTGYDITVPLARGEKFHMITPELIIEKIKEVAHFEY